MFAGGISGVVGWMSIYPCDVLKSRMQADALRPDCAPASPPFLFVVKHSQVIVVYLLQLSASTEI